MEEEKKVPAVIDSAAGKAGVDIDGVLDVVEEIIPDNEGKTRVGKWLRILDKFLKLKRFFKIQIK